MLNMPILDIANSLTTKKLCTQSSTFKHVNIRLYGNKLF